MLKRMIKRNLRQPVNNLVVILFAAVLSVCLCWMHKAAEEEQKSLEAAYAAVPVFFKVTDLDGSKVSGPDGIEGWVYDLFTERGLKPQLAPYVEQIHMRVPYSNAMWQYSYVELAGITSTYVAEELTEDWGGQICWNPGFDESCLQAMAYVILVPEVLKDHQELTLEIWGRNVIGERAESYLYTMTFQVAGYYIDPGNSTLYCSISAIEDIYAKESGSKPISRLGAVLNDNYQLDGLRETAAMWFAEPNPMGELTEWGRYGYEHYLYAMDIDTSMLTALEASMKNTQTMNRLSAALVFLLSAGAGFLTGFLVVRSRKREITLMRALGAPNAGVFCELALEQLLCVGVGVALGGGYTLWQPIGRLAIFCAVYMAGLTVALGIFLRANLLHTMKEDE